ncbi:hypothetical protein AB1K70_22940 [Bremerella sp. JC770]|uniref:hypothetical protein n=1 Tax=Bremerella sp. JC770 TaxID=3232137 RepID=UPI00345A8DDD
MQIYERYSELLEQPFGIEILERLRKDRRVNDMDGKLLYLGASGSRFDVNNLAMWYLSVWNDQSKERADQALEDYLDRDTYPVTKALWVKGIELSEAVEVANEISIVSIHEMPMSSDKINFLRQRLQCQAPDPVPIPEAAIIINCEVPKYASPAEDSLFWSIEEDLLALAWLLNLLPRVSCTPFYSTCYAEDVPFGIFGGSGGGLPLSDVPGGRARKISDESFEELRQYFGCYQSKKTGEWRRIQFALKRFSQARRRDEVEDIILDLCISLEMLLLNDNDNNNQLSLAFRLRGSWLIAESDIERVEIFKQLKDLYNYRSQVAHSGMLCKNKPNKIVNVRKQVRGFIEIAERILRKVILDGTPDWTKLVLNVK